MPIPLNLLNFQNLSFSPRSLALNLVWNWLNAQPITWAGWKETVTSNFERGSPILKGRDPTGSYPKFSFTRPWLKNLLFYDHEVHSNMKSDPENITFHFFLQPKVSIHFESRNLYWSRSYSRTINQSLRSKLAFLSHINLWCSWSRTIGQLIQPCRLKTNIFIPLKKKKKKIFL